MMIVPRHFAAGERWVREEDLVGWLLAGDKGKSYLQGYEHGMCFADETDDHRALLHGFLGIFDLEYPALRRAMLDQLMFAVPRTGCGAHNVTESLS